MTIKRLLGLLACLSTPCLWAAEPAPEPDPAYVAAVKSYITAASVEMQAVRQETDAANKNALPEVKKRYADLYAQLERCEKLLAELRSAPSSEFDRVKARYEQQRDVLLKQRAQAAGH
jgi:uncharacterized protein involved in exopolysaccharide biosynthesis